MLPPAPLPGFGPQGFGSTPVASVMAFAGALDPTSSSPPADTHPIEAWGWMLCDGRSLSVYLYPELFAALGYLYGGGGDQFSIPDYRGYFLRGTDGGAGVDPDVSKRTSASGGSSAYAGVGSHQDFALQDHVHDYKYSQTTAAPAQSGSTAGAPAAQPQPTEGAIAASGQPAVKVSPNETRPVNIYVNYIIKFTGRLHPTITPSPFMTET